MLKKHNSKKSLVIVSVPVSRAGSVILSNFINILKPIFEEIFVVTGDYGAKFGITIDILKQEFYRQNIHIISINTDTKKQPIIVRLIKYFLLQLKISKEVINLAKKNDIFVFTIGGSGLILPIALVKLLKKGSILIITGSTSKNIVQFYKNENRIIQHFLLYGTKIVELFSYRLIDKIIVYSDSLIGWYKLYKYRGKVYSNATKFVDANNFEPTIKISKRNNIIGFIGRFSKEKGIVNFVDAIQLISKKQTNLQFLLGGGGLLFEEITKKIEKNKLKNKVILKEWLPHNELPQWLNKLRVLVVPSYTEGFPNIVLEAMACGTPVLATPVGAIPDVIKDGETGFILEDNSPECIAKNVIRALKHPDLEKITKNARTLIEMEYTLEAAMERYRKILENI